MPRGTRYVVLGRLTIRHGGLAVLPDEGGTWRLEVTRNYEKWLGKRVQVDGIRDGFDLLAVKHTQLADADQKKPAPRSRSRIWHIAMQIAGRIRR